MSTESISSRVRVVILEDDAETRTRLRVAVERDPTMQLVAEFSLAGDALGWLEKNDLDVLITDLGLPDLPGLAVIAYCANRHVRAEILVISMYEDEQHVIRSLEAGASGYLLKDSLNEEIAGRIREMRAGGAPMSPVIARLVLKRLRPVVQAAEEVDSSWVRPTARELLVLTRIAQGFSYAEIAKLEKISPHTVHAHIRNIYSKLAVHSRTEAVFEASRLGLIVAPGRV
ncbi:MAG: response regulator transcription factor [Pseudomonadota bacterium]|nr:response regulator transcription factor [Pseudomonadota bacterium]